MLNDTCKGRALSHIYSGPSLITAPRMDTSSPLLLQLELHWIDKAKARTGSICAYKHASRHALTHAHICVHNTCTQSVKRHGVQLHLHIIVQLLHIQVLAHGQLSSNTPACACIHECKCECVCMVSAPLLYLHVLIMHRLKKKKLISNHAFSIIHTFMQPP